MKYRITWTTPWGDETDIIDADSQLEAENEAADRSTEAWADRMGGSAEPLTDENSDQD